MSFSFQLEKSQHVILEVLDVVGKRMGLIENETLSVGPHHFQMDVSKWPTGYYSVPFKTENDQNKQKLLVIH